MFSNIPSNPQVHAATGRFTECLIVRPLSDYAGHNVLQRLFRSYGMVYELLHVVTLKANE